MITFCQTAATIPEGVKEGQTNTLAIDVLDDQHVSGNVDLYDLVSDTMFSGTFDVPICPLALDPMDECCID